MHFLTSSWFITLQILSVTAVLQISELRGPGAVQNGSTSILVLDCIFTAEEADLTGLVVKWFFNRQPFPVYQWIPGSEPQSLGILKGRLDLTYNVSDTDWSKYRSLAILNPTTELSGEYACSVSSFTNEDVKRKTLIVYAPASEAGLSYRKPSVSSIAVTCHADGLFPEPKMLIYRSRPNLDSKYRKVITGSGVSQKVLKNGDSFDVKSHVILFEFELKGDTVFTCEVSIPGTNYHIHKELFYTPGQPRYQESVSSNLDSCRPDSIGVSSLLLVIFINKLMNERIDR